MIDKTLKDHLVVCGFGSGGEAAVAELLRQDADPKSIVVVESQPERVAAAMEMGVTTVAGDATHDATLSAARIDRARGILVSTGRNDTAALVVLSARRLNGAVPISASVQAVENEDLLRQAGASSVINPVSLGGHLLARSSTHRGAVDYIRDLAVADGRVVLRERVAQPDGLGRAAAARGQPRRLLGSRGGGDRARGRYHRDRPSVTVRDRTMTIARVSRGGKS